MKKHYNIVINQIKKIWKSKKIDKSKKKDMDKCEVKGCNRKHKYLYLTHEHRDKYICQKCKDKYLT